MSNYENGAYEALQWAWNMLRDNEENPHGVKVAKKIIYDKLVILGDGDKVSFRNLLIKKLSLDREYYLVDTDIK